MVSTSYRTQIVAWATMLAMHHVRYIRIVFRELLWCGLTRMARLRRSIQAELSLRLNCFAVFDGRY
jgi:hypothetical protein